MKTRFPALFCAVLAAACQNGGTNKNAVSEVKLAVDHHMSGFGGLARFNEGYPIKESKSYADSATLHFRDDGNYTLSRPGQRNSRNEKYFLAKNGELTITVAANSRSARRWSGFYDLDGDGFFFVARDRDFLRMFCGVRQISGSPSLAATWHVFGDTLIFAGPKTKPSPDRVGRAFAGTITMDKAGKLTAGSWKDSSGANVLATGTAKADKLGFLDVALSLKNDLTSARSFTGGIAKHVGVLMDKVSTDGNVGTLVLVRQIPTGADLKRLEGEWRVGLHAIFHRAGQSRVDVATGTLTLGADKSWKLLLSSRKTPFEGSFTIGNKGDLTLKEKSFNQDWAAAVDPDYRNIVIVDRTSERSGNPWVGIMFGVRVDKK